MSTAVQKHSKRACLEINRKAECNDISGTPMAVRISLENFGKFVAFGKECRVDVLARNTNHFRCTKADRKLKSINRSRSARVLVWSLEIDAYATTSSFQAFRSV